MNVLITHMHFDHSGGGHQFQEVWETNKLLQGSWGIEFWFHVYFQVFAHTLEVAALEDGDSIRCCPWVTDDEVGYLAFTFPDLT